MTIQNVSSFAAGQWIAPDTNARDIYSAVSGELIARAGSNLLDTDAMLDYARAQGGPALRAMTFHQRAKILKALALFLADNKQQLYDISFATGATQKDHLIDIDGGIGTMLVFASKGRREMPDSQVYLDGNVEQLSRGGTFVGQHICTPLQGVAIHINAFNFPVWGMLEKLAPAILAGVPAIIKPATASCYVTELAVKLMLQSKLLPAGALQLVSGGLGDMLDKVTHQDIVSFTGSAQTAGKLRTMPNILENSIRFIAEQDSLNASILGPDAIPGTPEFDLFLKEVTREMTTKAGQKCTAIRRVVVPEAQVQAVIDGLKSTLSNVVVGDPTDTATNMGALVSASQRDDVLATAAIIEQEAERVFGDPDNFTIHGANAQNGAFVPPMLFHCNDADRAVKIHEVEAFGPVSTVMGYRDVAHAINIINKGQGSLVASVITRDGEVAREVAMGAGAFHGRLYFNNRDSMAESTGHGSPLPHMVHGGPGRAGGGEEMGGVRGVMHYMQRTAIQGSPSLLADIGAKWIPGAKEIVEDNHPFTRTFTELAIGETFYTASRTISIEDIEHFAHFTGDTFYAHIDNLRFMTPVEAGDAIKVRLVVKHKTPRNDEYGEVRWHVLLSNQNDDVVAEYELLTMNAYEFSQHG